MTPIHFCVSPIYGVVKQIELINSPGWQVIVAGGPVLAQGPPVIGGRRRQHV